MYYLFKNLIVDDELTSALKSETDRYKTLPVWSELRKQTDEQLRSFQKKLYDQNVLTFDTLCNEPLGHYFLTLYLSQDSADKIQFVHDVNILKSLPKDSRQSRELMYKIYHKYYGHNRSEANNNSSHQSELKHNIEESDLSEHSDDFIDLIKQTLDDLKLNIFPKFLVSTLFDAYLRCKLYLQNHPKPSSFYQMRMLGCGGFGIVNACRKIDTGNLYAMKQIDKRLIQKKEIINKLIAEKECLSLMNSQFVISLKYLCMDKRTIYIIMDLMMGGNLRYHLDKEKVFSEYKAQYYCAQILLGLEYIHSKHITHRDLKLSNVLLDQNGNIKISDLGLAVKTNLCIHGYAGTPGYIDPRILLRQPYDKSVDLFSLGVVLYTMISGREPFEVRTNTLIFLEINSKPEWTQSEMSTIQNQPLYHNSKFNAESKNLCCALLVKNHKIRLGISGINQIKQHPWFDNINWESLKNGQYKPPFIPSLDEIYAHSHQHIIAHTPSKNIHKVKLTKSFNDSLRNLSFDCSNVLQNELVEILTQTKADISDINKLFESNVYNEEDTLKSNCLLCVVL